MELTFADIKIGDAASFSKTLTESDILSYAGLTGDFNPIHIDAEYARASMFKERIAHGMLVSGFISAVLGGAGDSAARAEFHLLGTDT